MEEAGVVVELSRSRFVRNEISGGGEARYVVVMGWVLVKRC